MVSRYVYFAMLFALISGCGRETTEPEVQPSLGVHVWATSLVARDTGGIYRDFSFWMVYGIPIDVWPRLWIEDFEMPRSSMSFSPEGFLVGFIEDYPTLLPLDTVMMRIRIPMESGDSLRDSAYTVIPPVPAPVLESDTSRFVVMWSRDLSVRENYLGATAYCYDSSNTYNADTFLFTMDTIVFLPGDWICPFDSPIHRELIMDVAYIGIPWKGQSGNFHLFSGRYFPISYTTIEMMYTPSYIHIAAPDSSRVFRVMERIVSAIAVGEK